MASQEDAHGMYGVCVWGEAPPRVSSSHTLYMILYNYFPACGHPTFQGGWFPRHPIFFGHKEAVPGLPVWPWDRNGGEEEGQASGRLEGEGVWEEEWHWTRKEGLEQQWFVQKVI